MQPTVVDLGDRVGVLRPIATAGVCLRCHGTAGSLAPEVRGYLETAYPGDRAIGFEEGDLRGFAWAEAPVDAATTPSEARALGSGIRAFLAPPPRPSPRLPGRRRGGKIRVRVSACLHPGRQVERE